MNYSSLHTMAGKDDNTARKFQSDHPDTSDIDAGWDAPEKKEQSEKERGKEDFLFIEPTKKVREEVHAKVQEAALPEVTVAAEDTFRTGQDLLLDLLDQNKVDHPPQMHVVSGVDAPTDNMYMVFEKSGALYGKTSPGQTPTNHDGMMASYDEKKKRLRVLLAHGPQHDEQAANLSTAAVVKGAFEEASNPEQSLPELSAHVYRNVESVKNEFGIEQKKSDVTTLELTPGVSGLLYELAVDNMGKNHCFVIDPETSKVRSIASNVKYPLRRGDLESLYNQIKKRTQELGKEPSADDMEELMLRTLEKEVLTEKGKNSLREHVAGEKEEGATSEQILDVLDDYFTTFVVAKDHLEPGEIVVVATDELMKMLETERGNYDHQMGNYILTKLAIPGRGLKQVCDEIVDEASQLQTQDKLEDASMSIIAFEAPLADLHIEKGEEPSVEDILKNS